MCCAVGPEAMALKGALPAARVGFRCWSLVPSASWPYLLYPAHHVHQPLLSVLPSFANKLSSASELFAR